MQDSGSVSDEELFHRMHQKVAETYALLSGRPQNGQGCWFAETIVRGELWRLEIDSDQSWRLLFGSHHLVLAQHRAGTPLARPIFGRHRIRFVSTFTTLIGKVRQLS